MINFKEKKGNFMNFFGVLKGIDWNSKESSMKDYRKSFGKRLQLLDDYVRL